ILNSLKNLRNENKKLQKLLGDYQSTESKKHSLEIIENAEVIGEIELITGIIEVKDSEELKEISDKIRETKGKKISLIGAIIDKKVSLVCAVSDELLSTGKFKAGNLIKIAAKEVGGGGGGKPHFATAGGKNPDKLNDAIKKFKEYLREEIKGNV
ncbi:DHHA1 domain-containing protein, partial [candidate division KSB1 bacterium]